MSSSSIQKAYESISELDRNCLVLIRGLPGSGKSTMAKGIIQKFLDEKLPTSLPSLSTTESVTSSPLTAATPSITTATSPTTNNTSIFSSLPPLTQPATTPAATSSSIPILSTNVSDYISEADDYFITNHDTGESHFQPTLLPEAHAACFSKTKSNIEINHYPIVIVSNTFIQLWEMFQYILLAKQNNYALYVIHTEKMNSSSSGSGSGNLTDAVLAQRNIHNVTKEKIQKMRQNFQQAPIGLWSEKNINQFLYQQNPNIISDHYIGIKIDYLMVLNAAKYLLPLLSIIPIKTLIKACENLKERNNSHKRGSSSHSTADYHLTVLSPFKEGKGIESSCSNINGTSASKDKIKKSEVKKNKNKINNDDNDDDDVETTTDHDINSSNTNTTSTTRTATKEKRDKHLSSEAKDSLYELLATISSNIQITGAGYVQSVTVNEKQEKVRCLSIYLTVSEDCIAPLRDWRRQHGFSSGLSSNSSSSGVSSSGIGSSSNNSNSGVVKNTSHTHSSSGNSAGADSSWWPHITIGFIERDIHDFPKTCLYNDDNYLSAYSSNNNVIDTTNNNDAIDTAATSTTTMAAASILSSTKPVTKSGSDSNNINDNVDLSVYNDGIDLIKCILHPSVSIKAKSGYSHSQPNTSLSLQPSTATATASKLSQSALPDDTSHPLSQSHSSSSLPSLNCYPSYDYVDISVIAVGGMGDDRSYMRYPDLVTLVPRGLVYVQPHHYQQHHDKQQQDGSKATCSNSDNYDNDHIISQLQHGGEKEDGRKKNKRVSKLAKNQQRKLHELSTTTTIATAPASTVLFHITPNTNPYMCVLRGLNKFTGTIGNDDDIELADTEANELLLQIFKNATFFTQSKKENGRSGLFSIVCPILNDGSVSNINSMGAHVISINNSAADAVAGIQLNNIGSTASADTNTNTSNANNIISDSYMVCIGTKLSHVLLLYNIQTNQFDFSPTLNNTSAVDSSRHNSSDGGSLKSGGGGDISIYSRSNSMTDDGNDNDCELESGSSVGDDDDATHSNDEKDEGGIQNKINTDNDASHNNTSTSHNNSSNNINTVTTSNDTSSPTSSSANTYAEEMFKSNLNNQLVYRNILAYQNSFEQCGLENRIELFQYLLYSSDDDIKVKHKSSSTISTTASNQSDDNSSDSITNITSIFNQQPATTNNANHYYPHRKTLITEVLDWQEQHIERLPDHTLLAVGINIVQHLTKTYIPTGLSDLKKLKFPTAYVGEKEKIITFQSAVKEMKRGKTEGCVLSFYNDNNEVIGLLKVKCVWYIICRAIREMTKNKLIYRLKTNQLKRMETYQNLVSQIYKLQSILNGSYNNNNDSNNNSTSNNKKKGKQIQEKGRVAIEAQIHDLQFELEQLNISNKAVIHTIGSSSNSSGVSGSSHISGSGNIGDYSLAAKEIIHQLPSLWHHKFDYLQPDVEDYLKMKPKFISIACAFVQWYAKKLDERKHVVDAKIFSCHFPILWDEFISDTGLSDSYYED